MRRFWEPEGIVKQIHHIRDEHLPLYASYVMKNHTKLFSAAGFVFGSWDRSLDAAGIDLNGIRWKGRLGWLTELRDAEESGRKVS